MAGIEDIINNPNFGRLYRNNSQFKKMADRLLSDPSTRQTSLFNKIKIAVNSDNQVSFNAGAAGTFNNLRDAVIQSWAGWRTNKATTASEDAFNGAYHNKLAQHLARSGPNVTVNVKTWDTQIGSIDDFYNMIGTDKAGEFLGLPIPNQEQIRLLEVIEGGKKLSMQEILSRLGWSAKDASSIFKRLGIATSDRVLSQVQDTPFNIVGFESSKVLGQSVPGLTTQIDSLAAIVAKETGATDIGKVKKEIWDTMSDGMSFVPDANIRDLIKQTQDEGRALIKSGRVKEGNALLESSKQMLKDFNKGISFNTRILGATDVATGANFSFGKGDMIRITNEQASRLQRLVGINPRHARDIAGFFPTADDKTELSTTGVRLRTFEAQGMPSQATSNVLTTATFQDFLNPNRYFEKGVEKDIAEGLTGLQEGKITPGIRKMIEELRNWTPDPSSTVMEIGQMREAQAFVRRLDKLTSAGVNFNISGTTTKQMFSALQKHYGRYQKGKFGRNITYAGQESPFFAMRFPMAGSTSAHIRNLDFEMAMGGGRYKQTGSGLLSNTLYIDQESGRFGLRGVDIYRSKAAFGGMDLDDRLYSVLRYDSSAKRLLAFTFRDPNAMGEYNIFDADITHDRNIPEQIRKVWGEKKAAEMKIVSSPTANKNAAMRDRDRAVAILDRYFNGQKVVIDGQEISQDFIEKVNIRKMFDKTRSDRMFAPTGYAVSDSFEGYESSFLRSMRSGKEEKLDAKTMAIRLARERAIEDSGQTLSSPFVFKHLGYSEYRQGTGYFKMPQAVKDYIESTKVDPVDLTSEAIRRRIAVEQSASGLLGRYVNAESVFDEFLQSNMKGLSPALQQQMQQTLQGMVQKLPDIPREVVIDATVKDAAEGVTKAAEEGILTYHRTMGYLIGHLQGLAGAGENVGLDPVFFQQRVLSNKSGLSAMIEGYQAAGRTFGSDADLLLPENDPKAYVSRMYKFFKDTVADLEAQGKQLSQAAATNMLKEIGDMQFSPEEMGRASQFLELHAENAQRLAEVMSGVSDQAGSLESLQAMMNESGDLSDSLLDSLRVAGDEFDEANDHAIRTLDEMGLFDSSVENGIRYIAPNESTDRQILAIAKLSAENRLNDSTGRTAADALELISSSEDGLSMMDLFTRAINSRRNADIGKIRNLSDLQTYMGDSNMLKTASHDHKLSLLDRIFDLATPDTADVLQRHADDVMGSIYDSKIMGREDYVKLAQSKRAFFGEIKEGILPLSRPSLTTRAVGPTGTKRFIRREAADSAAMNVMRDRPFRERIERLDLNYISKLVEEEPWAKKGLIGAAAFAVLGIGHKIAKEMTPEESQGPPLLPGGSAYENYQSPPTPSVYGSNFNSQDDGSLYQVDVASGNYDPYELQSAMQKITGGVFNTNVYNARPSHSLRMSAIQKINELRQ